MDTDNSTLEMAEALNQAAINERLVLAKLETNQAGDPRFGSWDKKSCFDCGDDLTAFRLSIGRVRCVDCQTIAERKGR